MRKKTAHAVMPAGIYCTHSFVKKLTKGIYGVLASHPKSDIDQDLRVTTRAVVLFSRQEPLWTCKSMTGQTETLVHFSLAPSICQYQVARKKHKHVGNWL